MSYESHPHTKYSKPTGQIYFQGGGGVIRLNFFGRGYKIVRKCIFFEDSDTKKVRKCIFLEDSDTKS